MGEPEPDRMLRRMRPSQLGEWLALYLIDPWGAERGDLQAAIVAKTIANVNRDPKKRPAPYRNRDFMAYLEPEPPPSSAELEKRLLAAFGQKVDPKKIRKKKGG